MLSRERGGRSTRCCWGTKLVTKEALGLDNTLVAELQIYPEISKLARSSQSIVDQYTARATSMGRHHTKFRPQGNPHAENFGIEVARCCTAELVESVQQWTCLQELASPFEVLQASSLLDRLHELSCATSGDLDAKVFCMRISLWSKLGMVTTHWGGSCCVLVHNRFAGSC